MKLLSFFKKREKLPRDVNRYALVLTSKPLFARWAKGLENKIQPFSSAYENTKIILLPFDIDSYTNQEEFGLAIYFGSLIFFADFAHDEKDIPKLDHEQIFEWFSVKKIETVMDYSVGNIQTSDFEVA